MFFCFYSSSETIEYHKMVWTLAFRIIEVALPINSTYKANFLKVLILVIDYIIFLFLACLQSICGSTHYDMAKEIVNKWNGIFGDS